MEVNQDLRSVLGPKWELVARVGSALLAGLKRALPEVLMNTIEVLPEKLAEPSVAVEQKSEAVKPSKPSAPGSGPKM